MDSSYNVLVGYLCNQLLSQNSYEEQIIATLLIAILAEEQIAKVYYQNIKGPDLHYHASARASTPHMAAHKRRMVC